VGVQHLSSSLLRQERVHVALRQPAAQLLIAADVRRTTSGLFVGRNVQLHEDAAIVIVAVPFTWTRKRT
jgi:hypothetical protein